MRSLRVTLEIREFQQERAGGMRGTSSKPQFAKEAIQQGTIKAYPLWIFTANLIN